MELVVQSNDKRDNESTLNTVSIDGFRRVVLDLEIVIFCGVKVEGGGGTKSMLDSEISPNASRTYSSSSAGCLMTSSCATGRARSSSAFFSPLPPLTNARLVSALLELVFCMVSVLRLPSQSQRGIRDTNNASRTSELAVDEKK